ncbi:DUF4214 domain-containing protein [Skermanella pratensis]|uniref:DUF4214 domain-containing protein n=1 Tax=Skermanella pratensis TaxID=2233999 RepID=UPI0013012C10|nr:DUF4214 domain-containing protein [Skermanella pratensis]
MANSETINFFYEHILQRIPSAAEVASWEAPLNSGALNIEQVKVAFLNSAEAQHVHAVVRLYQAAFGRVPDEGGLKYWVSSGKSMGEIADGFANSPEFTNRYGSSNVSEAFVTSLYYNVLGRAPDAGGLVGWTNSGLSAAQILAGFSESAEFKIKTTTATYVFLDNAAKGEESYTGGLFDRMPAQPQPEPVGQTFTLTQSVDTFVGNDGTDTINGLLNIDGINTLNALDSIDGGNGVDTLNISMGGANSGLPVSASIKNVEIINLVSDGGKLGGTGGTVDASRFVGAQQIWQIDAANNVTKLASSTTAGFKGVVADAAANLKVSAAATAASVSIALDNVIGDGNNVSRLSVDGAALNNVAISGSLAPTEEGEDEASLTLGVTVGKDASGKDLSTLTVNTSVDTSLNVTGAITTLAAGESTGGITYAGAPTVSSITTGSGNDDVSIGFATAKATSTVAAKDAFVYTANGDDLITVNTTGSGTTKVDGGHGDNTFVVGANADVDAKLEVISGDGIDTVSILGRSGTVDVSVGKGNDNVTIGSGYKTITVNAGEGNDIVHVMDADHEGYRSLTDKDVLDGGEGIDTIVVGASAMVNSGDYDRLANLTTFEHLRFVGPIGTEEVALDAAELRNFSQIEVTGQYIGDGNEGVSVASYVKNVSADQTIVVYGNEGFGPGSFGLAHVFAEGYDTDAIDYNAAAGVLNLKVQDSVSGIGVFAKSVNLTVEATTEGGMVAAVIGNVEGNTTSIKSDIDSATINLVSTVDAETEISHVAQAWVQSADAGTGFTSLTIKGTGSAWVDNQDGKLTSIDASQLGGTDSDGTPFGGLSFNGEASVKENIKLGSGIDDLTISSRAGNASLDKMDTITGFKLVMNEDGTDFAVGSDRFKLNFGEYVNLDAEGDDLPGDEYWSTDGFQTSATKFVAYTFNSAPTSLGAALNTVSALTEKAVVFKYGNDSYIYAENETGGTVNGNFEASDMLVKLVGITDVDALAKAASLSFLND